MITEGNPEEGNPILRKGNPNYTRSAFAYRIPSNQELKEMGYGTEEVALISLYHRNFYRLPGFLVVNQYSDEVSRACIHDPSSMGDLIDHAAEEPEAYSPRNFVRLVWDNY